jgi:hypothetical protein
MVVKSMYSFKQEVSLKDFQVFYNMHLKRIFFRPMNIIIALVFFVFLLSGPLFGNPETLIYAIVFVLIVALLFWWMPKNGEKLYSKDPDSFTMDYTLSESNITFQSKDGKSTKLWSEFYSMVETKDFVFIYLKNKRGLIFKKETLGEEATAFLIQKAESVMAKQNIKKYV